MNVELWDDDDIIIITPPPPGEEVVAGPELVFEVFVAAVVDIPEEVYEIERAVWNSIRLEALRSRFLEENDSRYELNRGEVEAYTEDKDGLRKLRKWRVPSVPYVPYPLDDENEIWGVLIDVTDITDEQPIGTWGDFVSIPTQELMGDPFGIICAIYKETNNVRIEFSRRAFPLSDNQDFEIPVRAEIYIQHYVMARALEREGEGQDVKLAAYYQSRYEAGVARTLKRKQAVQYQRKYVLGGSSNTGTKKPLARLPWQFGKIVR